MSSRDTILNALNKNSGKIDSYEYKIDGIQYDDLFTAFKENLELVGGNIINVENKNKLEQTITDTYPNEKKTLSLTSLFTGNTDIVQLKTGHELNDLDLCIIEGTHAVAENGAVWIDIPELRIRSSLFICQHLAIIIQKSNILNNMHEAYDKIDFNNKKYSLFISGPSKTADIEQSLVIGAHGPRSCTVFII
jgi:L-lactate dehydrogenase complex protein LldG